MNGEQNINPLFQYDDGLTDSQSQAKAAGLPYKHLNPQKTLRDEFAIELASALLMKLNFTGSFPDINGVHKVLMINAYQLADAAMKAREVQS